MKILFLKGVTLSVLLFLIVSCNNDSKKATENNIQFDSLMVDKTYHMMNIETNPSCSLQVKFTYPVNYPDKKMLSLIQQQFITCYFGEDYAILTPQEAVDKYLESYINDFKSQESDFRIDQQNHQSELDESLYSNNETSYNKIVYNHNDLLSITVSREYYKGGAHNAHSYLNYVFNLKTGKRIVESEIFIDDYQDNLANIIVHEIASSNKVNEASDLENMGFFNIEEIYPNKNFYVDADGINYTFNEFDIAAYVVGPIFVHLSYDKIRHLIRKDSPVASIAF